MLHGHWVAVTTEASVGERPLGLRRLGRPWVVWRDGEGRVRVAFDACPHRGAALSRGRVVDGCLECPYHGLRFDGDGACTRIPAHPEHERDGWTLHQPPVRVERGLVWMWSGPVEGPLPPIPWSDAIDAELRQGDSPLLDIVDTFDVSWLRVMENLTDYHHVPFVHRSVIPAAPEVTHFEARREGQHIWTEGTLGSSLTASTHIVGPCFASLSFLGTARFVVCATPIDDANTWLFARYTQDVVRIPGLAWLATWVLGQLDYRLLQRLQDAPVWRSQRLSDPADIGRYRLLPADEGVRLYFAMIEELGL